MKKLAVVMTFALVAVACGSGDQTSFDPDEGFTQGAEGQLRALAYAYQPDSSLTYGFTMGIDMDLSSDFDGLDEFGSMTMGMDVAGSLSYDVSPGPEEGTVALGVTASLSDFSMSEFTLDGEPMPADLAGFGDVEALGLNEVIPEMTVVVDSRGDVIELTYGDVTVPSELLNSFGGGGFGDPTGMGLFGSIFGPELPVEEARVGATWTTSNTQQVPGIGEMTVVTTHEIIGEESVAGRDTVVISSTSQMTPVSISMADLFEMMTDPEFLGTAGLSEDELRDAQLEMELMDAMDFDFEMEISYGDVTTTTWLDYEAGIVVSTDGAVEATIDMSLDTPEGSGTMSMGMNMTIGMLLTADGAEI
jgi:hypothetical protein